MYLSRYVISKESVILEIEPTNGSILRRFKQPDDWIWGSEREKAHWEEYNGKIFLVYMHEENLIFQEGESRFVLNGNYFSKMKRKSFKWILFQLFKGNEKVYEFKYQDPKTRIESLLRALVFDDDWWDWDTPFEDTHKYLQNNI